MSKVIVIKLTKIGSRVGPLFDIYDDRGNILGTDIPKEDILSGVSFTVDDSVKTVKIKAHSLCSGKCQTEIIVSITTTDIGELAAINLTVVKRASLWRHLTNPTIYNKYYDITSPYVIEYPFAYTYQDEILQNVKDYSKVYSYFTNGDGVWNDNDRLEIDNAWFNKAILYNGQQCSGLLTLEPKPKNNLKDYLKYPIYNIDNKTIVYTKSDNFYQYNTFWSLIKNKSLPIFKIDCCSSLSVDKVLNQANMDYSKRSFKKETLRAKDLKVRHILDSRSDIHLVSQFITTPSQISYK